MNGSHDEIGKEKTIDIPVTPRQLNFDGELASAPDFSMCASKQPNTDEQGPINNRPVSAKVGISSAKQYRGKGPVGVSKTMTRARLEQLFDTSMEGASGSLGVSTTIIKRLCRKHKVRRWPYRSLVTLDKQIERACTVLAQKQSTQVRSVNMPSASIAHASPRSFLRPLPTANFQECSSLTGFFPTGMKTHAERARAMLDIEALQDEPPEKLRAMITDLRRIRDGIVEGDIEDAPEGISGYLMNNASIALSPKICNSRTNRTVNEAQVLVEINDEKTGDTQTDASFQSTTGPLLKGKTGCNTTWNGKPRETSPNELVIEHNLEEGENKCGSSSK